MSVSFTCVRSPFCLMWSFKGLWTATQLRSLYLFLRRRFRWNRRPESSLPTLAHTESLQQGGILQGGGKDKEAVIKERQRAEKVEQKDGNGRDRFEGISREQFWSVQTTEHSLQSRGRNTRGKLATWWLIFYFIFISVEDGWRSPCVKIAMKTDDPKNVKRAGELLFDLSAVYLCFPDGVTLLVFKFGQQLGGHGTNFVIFGLFAFPWRGTIAVQVGGLNRAEIIQLLMHCSLSGESSILLPITSSLRTNLLQVAAKFPLSFVSGIGSVRHLFLLRRSQKQIDVGTNSLKSWEQNFKKLDVHFTWWRLLCGLTFGVRFRGCARLRALLLLISFGE